MSQTKMQWDRENKTDNGRRSEPREQRFEGQRPMATE